MNIVMLGYRGTGKSTVARLLARELERKLVNLDDLIVESAGMPIPVVVSEQGWPRFREIESRIVEEIAANEDNVVIDCGGGVVLDDNNTRLLRKNGKTILLIASFEAILKRIRCDPNRPPLKDGLSFEEEQRQILAERQEKYLSSADITFDTTKDDPLKTVKAIVEHLRREAWV